MIRRLAEPDRHTTAQFLQREAEFNLYQLGNLESLGFVHEICEFWADFGLDGITMRAILNRHQSGWIAFGDVDADWQSLGNIVDTHPIQATRLQDNPVGIASFLPYIRRYCVQKESTERFMRLSSADFRPVEAPAGVVIRKANRGDLGALIDFYRDAGSMRRSATAIEQPLRNTQVWVAEIEGQIAGAALTNAETRTRAMIGGVYTHPAFRNRHVATALCSALCRALLAAGREPALYWDSPAAGVVYRRLGFQEIGAWRSVWLAKRDESI